MKKRQRDKKSHRNAFKTQPYLLELPEEARKYAVRG